METMDLLLYKDSIAELEEYKKILKEGSLILGLDSKVYDRNLEYLVSFAITQALKAEREYLSDLKKRKGGIVNDK
ncbi:hypothetical protein PGH26_13695 [Sporosarcina jeotgali]|uniref:Uncharacterized protein n=1 Tax=Sporosarcina jeotgali TaxID=3020056 RepID=A0ABZ0KUV7_9BACL|nr:hypothetical protein [Sporosarcina sp. B2O-1]WOV83918.1 hypothetical protein PGH26_13695 [Sporosarcina sp. B2O-1]